MALRSKERLCRARHGTGQRAVDWFLAGGLLEHPDPSALRTLLVDGLALRELSLPPWCGRSDALCFGHGPWNQNRTGPHVRVPGSDRVRLCVAAHETSAAVAAGGEVLDEDGFPVQRSTENAPQHPLLTVGCANVEQACERIVSLGCGQVLSPPVKLASPPYSLGVRANEDSSLCAAVVVDPSGVQVELTSGFDSPHLSSFWLPCRETQPVQSESRRSLASSA
jgi:hypothetical protein